MRNKIIVIGVISAALVAGLFYLNLVRTNARSAKPDFVAYNSDGSLRARGVYETDRNGLVTKYSFYDGAGQLQYTEVPQHAGDGRILSAKQYGPDGKVVLSIEYTESEAKVFDAQGKLLETQAFSQEDYLKSQKK